MPFVFKHAAIVPAVVAVIIDRDAARNIRVVVEHNNTAVPARGPRVPTPAVMREESDRNPHCESDAESEYQTRRRRQYVKTGIRNKRRAPNAPRIVVRNVYQRRIHRRDENLSILAVHALLRRRKQAARLLCLIAHRLDGVHQVAGLIVVHIAELLRPAIIARHVVENRRERRQRLDARIPRHAIGEVRALLRRQSQVPLRPRIGLGHLVRVRRRG